MFLSRLSPNWRSVQAMREISDPYQLHRTLARGFGDKLQEARLMFRVDADNERPVIVAQSHIEPNWSLLPASYAMNESKPFDLYLKMHQRLRFRLAARPTKRDKTTGKRVTLRSDDEALEWLSRKGLQAGFSVASCRVGDYRWIDTRSPEADADTRDRGKSRALRYVRFDGVLVVTDPDKLKEAVRNGIGPQKAFGFGLLSLAPVQE